MVCVFVWFCGLGPPVHLHGGRSENRFGDREVVQNRTGLQVRDGVLGTHRALRFIVAFGPFFIVRPLGVLFPHRVSFFMRPFRELRAGRGGTTFAVGTSQGSFFMRSLRVLDAYRGRANYRHRDFLGSTFFCETTHSRF